MAIAKRYVGNLPREIAQVYVPEDSEHKLTGGTVEFVSDTNTLLITITYRENGDGDKRTINLSAAVTSVEDNPETE